VANPHPGAADRAADPARADDPDLHLSGSEDRQGQGAGGDGRPDNDEKLTTNSFHGDSSNSWIIRFLSKNGSKYGQQKMGTDAIRRP
jgi:hypothetical protein